jgi:Flp pilus assembly protein TadG
MMKLRIFRRSVSGTAAIEFAFIAPILLLMFAAIVEVGGVFQVYNSVNRLATQYAITWSDCSDLPVGTCNTEMSSFASGNLSANLVPRLTAGALTLRMFQVNMSGTTPTVTYAYPAGSTLTAAEISAAQGVLTTGQAGVVVTATYAHTLQYFPTLMSSYLSPALTASFTATQLKG